MKDKVYLPLLFSPSLAKACKLFKARWSPEIKSARVICCVGGFGFVEDTIASVISCVVSAKFASLCKLYSAMLLNTGILEPTIVGGGIGGFAGEIEFATGGCGGESGVRTLGKMNPVPNAFMSPSNDDCIEVGSDIGLLAVTDPVNAL